MLLGKPYFIDNDNSGKITGTKPTTGYYQEVGFVPMDSFFYILPKARVSGSAQKIKSTGQNRSSTTTLSDDSDLVIPLKTGKYNIKGHVLYSTANTTMGFKFGFAYSGTMTSTSNVKYIAGVVS